jgi:hypothetical protein
VNECQKCGAQHLELRKNRVSDGTYQVFWYCIVGQHRASSQALRHRDCGNIDAIPLLYDYAATAPRCSVRGCTSEVGTQGHHGDPQNRCGGAGPQTPLCRKHHQEYHRRYGW